MLLDRIILVSITSALISKIAQPGAPSKETEKWD